MTFPSLIPEDWMGMEEEQQATGKGNAPMIEAKISNRLKPASVEGSDLKSDTPNGSSGTLKNKLPEVPPTSLSLPVLQTYRAISGKGRSFKNLSHIEPQKSSLLKK
ncbi:hypothetical protein O9992_29360 [Vibrio lentus]|nr:hypothetical protein [Vibrio lentus]